MRKPFFVSIKALIRNHGKILMLIEDKGTETYWDLPGGGVEDFDTFEETLLRELGEEVKGISNIKIIKQIPATCEIDKKFVKENYRQLLVFYLVEADVLDIQLSEEHKGYRWIDYSDLDELVNTNNPILLEAFRGALEKIFS